MVKTGSFYLCIMEQFFVVCLTAYALSYLICINNIKFLLGPLISLSYLRNVSCVPLTYFSLEDIGGAGAAYL